MKRILLAATSLVALLLLLFLIIGHSTPKDLDERAEEALEYCKENGYSTDYCLLVDYGRHSGRVRFFLWDFEKEKPALKCLCAHGYGKGSTEKAMSKPKGRKALLLYGMDKTNSNALQRGILIHPVSLPDFSIYPLLIPVKVHKVFGYKIRPKSEGCITIPFREYSEVVETVKSSNKPLMLWVYE